MIIYIIKWSIIYLLLIFLLHNLYLFFQNNLTTTKIKDFYNYPNQEYNKINNILNSNVSVEKPKKESKVKNFDVETDVNDNKYSNYNLNSKSEVQFNTDAKIFPNFDFKNLGNSIESNENKFDLNNFNSNFSQHKKEIDNDLMKNELNDFLTKLNTK